jgi:uncharacterized membrane protein (UPF0127 family)
MRTITVLLKTALAISLASVALACSAQVNLAALPMKQLGLGVHKVQAEIAATPSDRQQGLMFRTSMPANQGMLFVFDESAGHCFWMKNTPLPLTIGFFDEAGVLINTVDMTPFNEASHCPTKPAKYALEMNQGWFAKNQIKPGIKITGLNKP